MASTVTPILIGGAGALAGASAVGTMMLSVPLEQMATSISGGAGAAIGYTAGALVATLNQVTSNSTLEMLVPVLPLVGAVAVPALAGGVVDQDLFMIAAGAWVGGYAAMGIYSRMKQ